MPFRLINDLKQLEQLEFNITTTADSDLTSYQLDLGDRVYDQIDRVLNAAEVLLSGSNEFSPRQLNTLRREGFETILTKDARGRLGYVAQTPKGRVTIT